MHKRITITIDEAVYDGLYRSIGKRRISQFIEDLLRPHVLDSALDAGYRAMAEDAYFSPSWTAFQADRGRDFSVIVDGVSV